MPCSRWQPPGSQGFAIHWLRPKQAFLPPVLCIVSLLTCTPPFLPQAYNADHLNSQYALEPLRLGFRTLGKDRLPQNGSLSLLLHKRISFGRSQLNFQLCNVLKLRGKCHNHSNFQILSFMKLAFGPGGCLCTLVQIGFICHLYVFCSLNLLLNASVLSFKTQYNHFQS